MKKKLNFLFILINIALQTGCLYAVRYDGTYHGKVVDQETREPIEGAVVLGTWSVYHFDVTGGHSTYYDAREAITAKNGQFVIPGQGLLVLGSVGTMGVLIYKTSYSYYQTGWTSIKKGLFSKEDVKWEGDMPVFPLRKLTEEERNKYSLPLIPDVPGEKILFMTREINKELICRGHEPL